jgi:hypothetical protein
MSHNWLHAPNCKKTEFRLGGGGVDRGREKQGAPPPPPTPPPPPGAEEEGEPHKLESKGENERDQTGSASSACLSCNEIHTLILKKRRKGRRTLLCSKRMTLVRLISSSWHTYCSQWGSCSCVKDHCRVTGKVTCARACGITMLHLQATHTLSIRSTGSFPYEVCLEHSSCEIAGCRSLLLLHLCRASELQKV